MTNQYGELTIPVTQGCGYRFTVDRCIRPIGTTDTYDYSFGTEAVRMLIDLRQRGQIQLNGVLNANGTVTVTIPTAVADRRTDFSRWRLVCDDESPLCLGGFERRDGGQQVWP
jgi:hypothetical protein